VRDLRGLIAHRQRLLRMRTMCRNRLHSLIHRYNLTPPQGELFAAKHRDWWATLGLVKKQFPDLPATPYSTMSDRCTMRADGRSVYTERMCVWLRSMWRSASVPAVNSLGIIPIESCISR